MDDFDELADRARGDDESAREAARKLSEGGRDAVAAVLRAAEAGGPLGLLPQVVCDVDPVVVQLLIDGLESTSYDVLKVCTSSLGRLRERRAVEPLLRLLADDKKGDVDRALAAEALGDIGDARAVDVLSATVDAKRPELVWDEWPILLVNAAVAAAKMGEHGKVDAVLDALRSDFPTARSLAAEGLRIVTGPGAEEALVSALHDRAREVRRAAINSVYLFGTAAAAEALVGICEDDVDDIAVLALLRLGDLIGEVLDEDDGEEEARAAWESHRADFSPGICHREGRPLQVLDLLALATQRPDRRADLVEELRAITGLPIGEMLREQGADAVADELRRADYPAGGFFKWGRRRPLV